MSDRSVNFFLALPLSLAAMKYATLSPPIEMGLFSLAFLYGTFFSHRLKLFALLLALFCFTQSFLLLFAALGLGMAASSQAFLHQLRS